MRILITGGAGFIGSNLVRHLCANRPELRPVVLDKLTYAGNFETIRDLVEGDRIEFVRGDICDPECVDRVLGSNIDAVLHLAAESHVDRSIHSAAEFVRTNVLGTQVLLEAALRHGVKRYVQVSTDEVYGSLGPEGLFTEETPLDPSSPYSASKTAADLLVQAYVRTHGFPAMITRCSNNYGPHQFPEKLIPLFTLNAMDDKPLPLYGDGKNVRDWIHVDDHCRALELVLERGEVGRVYNVGGGNERTNIEITQLILRALGKPQSLIKRVTDRPGHDRRYAIDSSRIESELGWLPQVDFAEGIARTVDWYRNNLDWCKRIISGEHERFYDAWYGRRLAEAD
ncbi:MAG: dTDP-glucose 4,6-dehydratase [Candidatus Alcyoniella australis]|nr:dTDP-glucose 4,6-dehydratase [Candidatus Alcyoniella australis]